MENLYYFDLSNNLSNINVKKVRSIIEERENYDFKDIYSIIESVKTQHDFAKALQKERNLINDWNRQKFNEILKIMSIKNVENT